MAWLGDKKIDLVRWKGEWVSIDVLLNPGKRIWYKYPEADLYFGIELDAFGKIADKVLILYGSTALEEIELLGKPAITTNLLYTRSGHQVKVQIEGRAEALYASIATVNQKFGIFVKGLMTNSPSVPSTGDIKMAIPITGIGKHSPSVPTYGDIDTVIPITGIADDIPSVPTRGRFSHKDVRIEGIVISTNKTNPTAGEIVVPEPTISASYFTMMGDFVTGYFIRLDLRPLILLGKLTNTTGNVRRGLIEFGLDIIAEPENATSAVLPLVIDFTDGIATLKPRGDSSKVTQVGTEVILNA